MKKVFIVALMLNTIAAAGQELKKITNTTSITQANRNKEEYHVLKDAIHVKHGVYKRWMNKDLVEQGYYKSNQKDSTWTYYGVKLRVLCIGNYTKDEKTGVWKYYSNGGELEREYDFSNKKIISFKPDSLKKSFQVINDRDTTDVILSCPPVYIGGNSALYNVVARSMLYPEDAVRNNIGGKVIVSFVIDESGKTSDYKVVKKIYESLDNEAIRVMKLVNNWLPAARNGKLVKVIHTMPLNFINDDAINSK